MAHEDKDLLTNAARAIGSALGKVSTTLHLAESEPVAAAPPEKSATKQAITKKPVQKKAPKKTAARTKKSVKRTKT